MHRKLCTKRPRNFFLSDMVVAIKLKAVRWAGHVPRVDI
jgi:hypothetical protein